LGSRPLYYVAEVGDRLRAHDHQGTEVVNAAYVVIHDGCPVAARGWGA
jgi:uncharacterized Zn-binding protein involved in type VI secretion